MISSKDNFDVVGSYFVDVYYNTMYSKAKQQMAMAHNKAISVTDIYLSMVNQYPSHCQSKFGSVIHMVYNYYIRHIGPVTFEEFEIQFISGLIPSDYMDSITVSERNRIIKDSIVKLVKGIGEHIHNSGPGFVIDNRAVNGTDNARVLQKKAVEILCQQRAEYYSKFNNIDNKTVPLDMFNKLKAELANQISLKVAAVEKAKQLDLKLRNTDRSKEILLQAELGEKSQQLFKYRDEIEQLRLELHNCKSKLAKYESNQIVEQNKPVDKPVDKQNIEQKSREGLVDSIDDLFDDVVEE